MGNGSLLFISCKGKPALQRRLHDVSACKTGPGWFTPHVFECQCCVQVCTAQYFVWWLTLLPLVLPDMDLTMKGIVWPSLLWVLPQLHWLLWGYLLEFQGKAVHLQLWFASIVMLTGNIRLMSHFIKFTRPVQFCYTANSSKLHSN